MTQSKIAYSYNENKFFSEECKAHKSPLEEGIYHLPANATFEKPLEKKEGFNIVWDSNKWEYQEIPKPEPKPEPKPRELTFDEKRREGYGPIGDQLDMIWHDEVNGTKVWISHITKVKNDIPKN